MLNVALETDFSPDIYGVVRRLSPWPFEAIRKFFSGIAAVFVIVGAFASLSPRRPEVFLLVVSPILAAVAANQLMLWPFGAVRANVFMYGYFILLFYVGVGFATQWTRLLRYPAAACLFAWFGVLSFPNDVQTFANVRRPTEEQLPRALAQLAGELGASCSKAQLVLINSAGSHAFEFYTRYHSEFRSAFADQLGQCGTFEYTMEAFSDPAKYQKVLAAHFANRDFIWFLYSHLDEKEVSLLMDIASRFGNIIDVHRLNGAGFFGALKTK
jgi:hypothetical protein